MNSNLNFLIRPAMKKLPRSFYLRPTLRVAKDLLGKTLIRKIGKRVLSGKIVEVEAYLGSKDPASHAFRGKTKRNEVMFRKGGHLYVYFTYGMHYCANVVTGSEGVGEAVLIRGVEPIAGIETMRRNRKFRGENKDEKDLTNGPAKFCQAFGIGREQNGVDLLGDKVFLVSAAAISPPRVARSMRVGITRARHHLWRFFIKGNRWVSK